jgi:hypothetical protein
VATTIDIFSPRPVFTSAVALLLLAAIGCSRGALPKAQQDDTAELTLALTAPADVSCVVLTVAAATTKQLAFSLVGGQPVSFPLQRLPVGVVVFSVDAFKQSCETRTVPAWVGGPVSAKLQPGFNPPITIVLTPSAGATVNIDFADAGPTCAAVGAACLNDGECCMSGHCALDPARPGQAGICAAPMADAGPIDVGGETPAKPSVQLRLEGEVSYLIYSLAGGAGCGAASPSTWLVEVGADQQDGVCVPAALANLKAIKVNDVSYCEAGVGCSKCSGDSCALASCFQKAEPRDPGECLNPLEWQRGGAKYLLVPKVNATDPHQRPARLPRFLAGPVNRTLTITPPESEPAFAVATMGGPVVEPDDKPDMCGSVGLCGIVPYSLFGGSFWNSWFIVPSFGLLDAPLF